MVFYRKRTSIKKKFHCIAIFCLRCLSYIFCYNVVAIALDDKVVATRGVNRGECIKSLSAGYLNLSSDRNNNKRGCSKISDSLFCFLITSFPF